MFFSGAGGLNAYSAIDGRPLWHRGGVVFEATDSDRPTVYVTGGSSLIGLDPLTGKVATRAGTLGAAGLYAVSDGVALGLDEGALGDAYGYRLTTKRVIWTAKNVPWPHFFVDLSGIGGSAAPDGEHRRPGLLRPARAGRRGRHADRVPAAGARRGRPVAGGSSRSARSGARSEPSRAGPERSEAGQRPMGMGVSMAGRQRRAALLALLVPALASGLLFGFSLAVATATVATHRGALPNRPAT